MRHARPALDTLVRNQALHEQEYSPYQIVSRTCQLVGSHAHKIYILAVTIHTLTHTTEEAM